MAAVVRPTMPGADDAVADDDGGGGGGAAAGGTGNADDGIRAESSPCRALCGVVCSVGGYSGALPSIIIIRLKLRIGLLLLLLLVLLVFHCTLS